MSNARNILDMAEVDFSSVTNLQNPQHTCANCSTSETAGHVQGANGNFFTHLNKSIKHGIVNRDGKDLPSDGKNLPHEKISDLTTILSSGLKLADQGARAGHITSNLSFNTQINQLNQQKLKLSNEQIVDTLIDPLAEEINAAILDLQQLNGDELNLDNLNSLAFGKIADPKTEIDLKSLELPIAEKSITQITDGLEEIIQSNIKNISDLDSSQTNYFASISHPPSIQSTKSGVASIGQYLDSLKQLNSFDGNNLSDEAIELSNLQTKSESLKISEKLNDLFARNISNNNGFENLIQNKSIEADKLNNHLSFIKSESGSNSVNLANITDSFSNLNTNSSYNKAIETPLPILIKHGASLGQNQQSVDQSIAQNIKWLLGNKVQNAKINVYPESLGQVNIALNLEESNLKINIIAASNATKELIEASISTLRTQFSESGINLQDVNVDTRFTSQSNDQSEFSNLSSHTFDHDDEVSIRVNNETDSLLSSSEHSIKHVYLLDAYA